MDSISVTFRKKKKYYWCEIFANLGLLRKLVFILNIEIFCKLQRFRKLYLFVCSLKFSLPNCSQETGIKMRCSNHLCHVLFRILCVHNPMINNFIYYKGLVLQPLEYSFIMQFILRPFIYFLHQNFVLPLPCFVVSLKTPQLWDSSYISSSLYNFEPVGRLSKPKF